MKNFSIPRKWKKHIRLAWKAQRVIRWNKLPPLRLLLPENQLPRFVKQCQTTMSIRGWLALLDWSVMPEPSERQWFGRDPVAIQSYIAAFLVKIHHNLPTVARLRRFLLEHPALVWGLGFPLRVADQPLGFDAEESLPTRQHFCHVLTTLSQPLLQSLLSAQVQTLQKLLPETFGQVVSIDTTLIIAWVKENNPKSFIKEGRFDKEKQPAGDSDCKVGCKRRHNRQTPASEGISPEGLPASVGEFYWGYASGAVVTKVEGYGEFVLAELTDTFDKGDTLYFFSLMAQVEERLGFRPPFGTGDAAYDAFYVYEYFHNPETDGFAAIPFSAKGGKPYRTFDEDGHPLCDAEYPMSLKFTYNDRKTAIIPYRRQKYVCPLLYPTQTGETCPIDHKKWPKGGCTTTLAESIGSRLRHQLDRDSERYKEIYAQRTAVERVFSRAKALGMERPKLRNQQAIANLNTLTYLVVNLQIWPDEREGSHHS